MSYRAKIDLIKAREQIEYLLKALEPFANAGERCLFYKEPKPETEVIALQEEGHSDTIYQLHAIDQDLHGEPSVLLKVQHLIDAHNLLRQLKDG